MHLALPFLYDHCRQPAAAARATDAAAVFRFISGAVDAADDEALVAVEKLARLPVHFHRHVQAAVDVGVHHAVETQHEGALRATVFEHVPNVRMAAFFQRRASTQKHRHRVVLGLPGHAQALARSRLRRSVASAPAGGSERSGLGGVI